MIGTIDTLFDHFDDHGHQFGAEDAPDYARMANEFHNSRGKYQVKVDKYGNIRVCDRSSNTFGSYNSDGTTRAFFKPDNWQKYFNSQPGK